MPTRWSVPVLWLVTRAGLIVLLLTREHSVLGDVDYYRASFEGLDENGLDSTLVEYPLPGVALVGLPWFFSNLLGLPDAYAVVVAALALVTDAAFLWMIAWARRWGRPEGGWLGVTPAEWTWLLAVPLLGATTYARFDLVPGILVGVAVLYAAHRPAFATAAAAVATGLKYWPALVLPAMAAPRVPRLRVLAVTTSVGGTLALGSLLVGGWDRLFSPMVWQSDRGLQIESVAATPAMLAFAADPVTYLPRYTEHNAYEIFGPMVPGLLKAGEVATVVVVLALLVLWYRAWRLLSDSHRDGVDAVVWICLAAITGFMCTSKVFSPQYLLWLLPAAAAGLAVLHSAESWHRLTRWVTVLLVATALTHLFFPLYYGPLIEYRGSTPMFVFTLVLRNLLMLWLLVEAFREAWLSLGRAQARRYAQLPDADRVTTA